jgi:hypothetical protein
MPEMFSCKVEMQAWLKAMRMFSSTAMPNAVANTLNRTADLVKAGAVHNIRQDYVVRTPYTINSVRMSPARPKPNLSGYAMVFTFNKYLPVQESGGTHHAPKIPTITGSRAGSKSTVIPPSLRLSRISPAMTAAPQKGQRKTKTSKPFVLNLRRGPGIYVRRGKMLIMIRDLSKGIVRIKPTHWFTRAIDKFGTFAVMHAIFTKELKAQLARLGK